MFVTHRLGIEWVWSRPTNQGVNTTPRSAQVETFGIDNWVFVRLNSCSLSRLHASLPLSRFTSGQAVPVASRRIHRVNGSCPGPWRPDSTLARPPIRRSLGYLDPQSENAINLLHRCSRRSCISAPSARTAAVSQRGRTLSIS
jgi:hypothetical protein